MRSIDELLMQSGVRYVSLMKLTYADGWAACRSTGSMSDAPVWGRGGTPTDALTDLADKLSQSPQPHPTPEENPDKKPVSDDILKGLGL
jgi:hypothetical protein